MPTYKNPEYTAITQPRTGRMIPVRSSRRARAHLRLFPPLRELHAEYEEAQNEAGELRVEYREDPNMKNELAYGNALLRVTGLREMIEARTRRPSRPPR
jgi:hypothetical protein